MNQLQDIRNYLVVQNGTIVSHKSNDKIKIIDNKIIVDDAGSLQIIYLIDQTGNYKIDLSIKGSLELVETYDFKVDAKFIKNIEILENSNILRYVDNQSNIEVKTNIV